MSKINILKSFIDTDNVVFSVLEQKLGNEGMKMLDAQLGLWFELNEGHVESPLRESLKKGDTTLPEGTLLHGASMRTIFDEDALQGIARLGIVSGELVGKEEDSETHGCADFFRVEQDTTITDYVFWARKPAQLGAIRASRGERLVLRGVSFIVDPRAAGMSKLLINDGYRNEDMKTFVRPPASRTMNDTAAILGGVPRGAIAGLLVGDNLLDQLGVAGKLVSWFPNIPIVNHQGALHR